ncbi:sugar ABC transporter permease [Paenibacillus psychroresistens]|uniref:Sugar ABC transporter permease n=1 Tax=Paenibacillus psychroresistens TaxID=1778678 RepID=A0A6B8RVV8_9BACL|nr:ABC transporter permease subunit [Paenibacillus psychroresistens]QGQ99583.1 sugar ABC transporter permease [Paenibacillus psychroresistens]
MLSKKWRRVMPLHLMLLPALVLLIIYSYGPIVGLLIAFERFMPSKGIFGSPLVGWENFKYVWDLPDTKHVLTNTVVIAFFKILLNLIIPIILALLLNEVRLKFFKRTIQTAIYFPYFLSWVLLGGILIDILSPSQGIVNEIIQFFGFKPIFFLGDPHWFRFTIVATDLWKEVGFNTIVFLAAVTNANPSLYEAAVIDGANRWKQTLNVTLPSMLPVIILMATLSMGNVLNAGFDQIFNLYSPQVYSTGDILDTFVYRIGLIDTQYGVATAVGLFKSVVSCCFISISYILAYRLANYRIF